MSSLTTLRLPSADTGDTWIIDVYEIGGARYYDFRRSGISMGGGTLGYLSVFAGPSGQRNAVARIVPDERSGYRVPEQDERYLVGKLQDAGLADAPDVVRARGIQRRHARR